MNSHFLKIGLILLTITCSSCAVYTEPGPPPPAYGYYGPAYPWAVRGNFYGGGGGGWHGGGYGGGWHR